MNNSKVNLRRRPRESGSGLIEFVLCTALFWCPFFFGMWALGINIIRAIQVTEVCRDAAHMLAYGIDFSDAGNQAVLAKVAQGMNLATNGNTVIILSYVTYIDDAQCVQGNLQANTSSCPNYHTHVITRRTVIGNSTLRTSAFGTPNAGDTDSLGNIALNTYLTDKSCQATNGGPYSEKFAKLMTLSSNQYAYMAEMTLRSTDLNTIGLTVGNKDSSARSIF